jgi:hypothetical protein
MNLRHQLLLLARLYGQATSLSAARISTIVFNDGKTIDRIGRGGDIRTGSFERAVWWFSDHWPDGLPWPDGVHRPSPSSELPGTTGGPGSAPSSCEAA